MNEETDLEEYAPWLVVGITLGGFFLRVLLLGMKSMWLDETFSVWLASHSLGEMLQWILKIDQHPPLYYLLLHYWMALTGASPYSVRLLSALLGAATIPVMYGIGKRMLGGVGGLAAALFLALSPFNIFFAQETRMYTLLTFNAAAALYALLRLLTDPAAARPIGSQLRAYGQAWRSGRRRPAGQPISADLAWAAWIVFAAATLYSHNTAVLFLLAVNIYVPGLMLYQRWKKPSRPPALQAPSLANWLVAQAAILLLWSPWIAPFIQQARSVYQHFWVPRPTWQEVLQVLKSLLNAAGPLPAYIERAIWMLYALVLVLGLVYFRKKLSQLWFLAALIAVPVLGELAVSLQRPIFLGRTLIWLSIPLLVLLAAGAVQLRFRFLILTVVGILGCINLFSASDYFRFYQKEDWETPAGYVAQFAEKGDLVLFNSNFVEIPFDYYFEPYREKYSIQVVERGLPRDLLTEGVLEPEMTPADIPGLAALLRGHERVWLVYSHNDYTDPGGLIPQTLAAQMKLTRTRDFYGGQVQLFERR